MTAADADRSDPTQQDATVPAPTPAEPRDGADPAYGFPAGLWRAVEQHPPPGLKRLSAFRSPLRGPWLTSVFGSILLVTLPIVIITGLLDWIAYSP